MTSIDTSSFTAMCRGLQKLPTSKSLRQIIENQTGQLLGVCIKQTHAAKSESIKRGVRFKNSRLDIEGGPKLTLSTAGGRDWFLEPSTWERSSWQRANKVTKKTNASGSQKPPKLFRGNSAHLMNGDKRWSNARWARYRAMLAELKSRKLSLTVAQKSKGLAKASWYQIAKDLGVDGVTAAPAFVVRATTFLGKPAPKMGRARRIARAHDFVIEITNRNEALTGNFKGSTRNKKGMVVADLNGHSILQRAIATRASAFNREVKHGLFSNIEYAAKRYPGIVVT